MFTKISKDPLPTSRNVATFSISSNIWHGLISRYKELSVHTNALNQSLFMYCRLRNRLAGLGQENIISTGPEIPGVRMIGSIGNPRRF